MHNPAGVAAPGADGCELPVRRRGLTVIIFPPAGDGAVPHHSAGVLPPDADGGEFDFRCARVS